MREIRTYGSEGGGTLTRPPYPYSIGASGLPPECGMGYAGRVAPRLAEWRTMFENLGRAAARRGGRCFYSFWFFLSGRTCRKGNTVLGGPAARDGVSEASRLF